MPVGPPVVRRVLFGDALRRGAQRRYSRGRLRNGGGIPVNVIRISTYLLRHGRGDEFILRENRLRRRLRLASPRSLREVPRAGNVIVIPVCLSLTREKNVDVQDNRYFRRRLWNW